MPRIAKVLSELEIKNLPIHTRNSKPVGHSYAVGGCPCLHIYVSKTGTKSWIFKPTLLDGKRPEIGLGSFAYHGRKTSPNGKGGMTAAEARAEGHRLHGLVKLGINPLDQKHKAKADAIAGEHKWYTWKELAEKWIEEKASIDWKTPKQVQRFRQYLSDYINPVIGNLRVCDLQQEHFKQILEPIYFTKNPTARRLINYCEAVIAFGISFGQRPDKDNPAQWSKGLDQRFPASSKIHKVTHQPSLPWPELPAFMQKLLQLAVSDEMARLLVFQILTVARPSEAALADWQDIDLEQKCWFVPNSETEKHKSKHEIIVPLTPISIEMLTKQSPKPSGKVFRTVTDKDIPNNYVSPVIQLCGVPARVAVPHGFRGTFETFFQEQTDIDRTWSDDAVRLAMKHVNTDRVRAAYARGQCYHERVRLMAAWEDFAIRGVGKQTAVPIKREPRK
jgi:integrase